MFHFYGLFEIESAVQHKVDLLHCFKALLVSCLTFLQLKKKSSIQNPLEAVECDQSEYWMFYLELALSQMYTVMLGRLLLNKSVNKNAQLIV